MEVLKELAEAPGRYTDVEYCTRTPGIVARAYRTYRSFGAVNSYAVGFAPR